MQTWWKQATPATRVEVVLSVLALVAALALLFARIHGFHDTTEKLASQPPSPADPGTAEATRAVLDPFAKENRDILTASFIGPPDPYDANIILFRSVRELSDLIASADKQGKTLFINFGFLTTAQIRFRPILSVLGDSNLFEKTAELQVSIPLMTGMFIATNQEAPPAVTSSRNSRQTQRRNRSAIAPTPDEYQVGEPGFLTPRKTRQAEPCRQAPPQTWQCAPFTPHGKS